MATAAELLKLIPNDGKYSQLRDTISLMNKSFKSSLGDINGERIRRWISEIDSGKRDDTDIRSDIFRYIVGEEEIRRVYELNPDQAKRVISGDLTFAKLHAQGLGPKGRDAGGGVNTKPGAPGEETKDTTGVGGVGDPALHILTGKKMKWYFDPGSGKWYVSYGLPNSSREYLFEASPKQMDALFGEGHRPVDYTRSSFKKLTQREGTTFGGGIAEMEGTGSFEAEYEHTIALALDEGKLPDWAKKDDRAMEIIFIAQAENKSDDWVLDQFSKMPSFKKRFPEIDKLRKAGNLTLGEAVQGFLEFEGGVKKAATAAGNNAARVSPALIGALMTKGYSLKTVQDSYQIFDRYEKHRPAIQAFNQVLKANGQKAMGKNDVLKFLKGTAPQEVYDLYEASALRESAVGEGLGRYFSANEALDRAMESPGNISLDQATQGMQQAAKTILQYRRELDLGAFDLDHEDLVDLSLGFKPRSGTNQAELNRKLEAALRGAQVSAGVGASPFVGFTDDGRPQARSISGGRSQY